jgi:DNA-directed RNA polymerase specialized sigma24 family protein
VALNRLLSRKRDAVRWGKVVVGSLDNLEPPAGGGSDRSFSEPLLPASATTAFELVDAPLIELMRDAIREAFAACPAEEFVMLQLAHCDGMRLADLARMWRCSQSRISRTLASAGEDIARGTMRRLRASDAWLEIRWEDFLEVCQSANPLHFAAE